ncbi:M48 family metallopeptidase [Salinilacihabitans rarus]|uniref:M48 family metallopeptidase n=1 Tax=Salinilacihabitans rarus TaxID=2961596 RepID=UPI0020C8EC58|nr:SprT family zinc-dependent metalloprotease [Salinilacihabitans rarus]
MAKAQLREIDLLGDTIEYEVRHSTDATKPRIDVDIHGVTVVLPEPEWTEPTELLRENAAWVVEKTRKYDKYREQAPERTFEEGECFPYLGQPHEVVVEQRPSSSVIDGKLRLAQYHVTETSIKRVLETLYRRNARQRFERRANHFADEMDVEYDCIEIRNQRTRWGSCSTNGTLGLNWRLMMAPPEIIDYIIIHELAHLREANHDPEFWSLVAEYDPKYESHAEWLQENSARLIFSDDDL